MRVLVTRPEPGAAETKARLIERGFEPLILPLTKTVPLQPDIAKALVDVVAVTSPNAIRHAPGSILDALKDKPVYAVGIRTGREARSAGLDVVNEDAGDAEGLARRIDADFAAPCHVTVLCGRVRRDVLEMRLKAAGHLPRLIEIYDTLPLEPSAMEIEKVLGEAPVDAVLLHSANGAVQFCRLMRDPFTRTKLLGATFYCLSQRIADALQPIAPKRTEIAASPSEDSLLSLLAPKG
ncbi:uroporphyrinogen-III synthase [Nitratireductor indicus]|uniref:uroporphyrinogen-III synthase n=1 Tax=Nitratireductor indicus TaxID=721133 RepID=UPI0028766260|nr:uroporphyrinogen-III synthase [Nitratireductor indicus]MDS1136502.1 uroporphyrinogen-III synthase [Nitratireductor indicus]